MSAFEHNTETVLARTSTKAQTVFEEGKKVDFLHIWNQYHKVGTWEYVVDKGHVFWSAEVYEIHGLPPDIGAVDVNRAIKFYFPEDAKRLSDMLATAIKLKSGFKCKLRLRRTDGALRITESTAAPVLDASGRLTRLVGTFRDITSQTEHENTRVANQDLLKRMISCLPVGSALFDRQMQYQAWSSRWLSDLGVPEDTEIRGKCHYDIFSDIASIWRPHFDHALKGNALGKDNDRIVRGNGVVHLVDWRLQPWVDKTGTVGGVLALFHMKYTAPPKLKSGIAEAGQVVPLQDLANMLVNAVEEI